MPNEGSARPPLQVLSIIWFDVDKNKDLRGDLRFLQVLEANEVLPHLEVEEQGAHQGPAAASHQQDVTLWPTTVTFFMFKS